jgi:hypothetical protein
MDDPAAERQALAVAVAVEAARREARVDQILADHARDLDNLGGMVRGAVAKLDKLSEEQEKRDAINADRQDRGQKKLTTFQSVGLAAGVLIALGGFLLPLVQALGHG